MKINMELRSLWKIISRLQEAQVLCCLGLAHVQVNLCYLVSLSTIFMRRLKESKPMKMARDTEWKGL